MIDLFAGLGGWAEGGLAEGYRVVGFDIERHQYGEAKYPAQLVIQDVLTLHGSQFKDAALIVASPPCQAYSYRAMPWKRAKELPPPDNTLFEACFRIQREACEAAGRRIPLVVENVRGAQKWVGRAGWHFGSFYLWGDIPALMPIVVKRNRENGAKTPAGNCSEVMWKDRPIARLAHATPAEMERHGFDGVKVPMPPGGDSFTVGFQQVANLQLAEGTKAGKDWFGGYGGGFGWDCSPMRRNNSKSKARKAASAHIAKIPFVLAQHIARAWKPS